MNKPKPKTGWKGNLIDGFYYCPHIPDFLLDATNYQYRQLENGTQIFVNNEWKFIWDLNHEK